MQPPPPKDDEIFDVVDERDAVIGTERRAVVHANHLRHRAVHIVLRTAANQVFLPHRAKGKDMTQACFVSSFRGHLDSGEDYLPAAVRELGEELGVAVPGLEPVLKIEACRQTGNEFVWVYRGVHEGPFVLQPEEISDGRFFAPDEVDRGIAETPREFSPAFRYVWEKVGGLFR